jgi:hypothetical protein
MNDGPQWTGVSACSKASTRRRSLPVMVVPASQPSPLRFCASALRRRGPNEGRACLGFSPGTARGRGGRASERPARGSTCSDWPHPAARRRHGASPPRRRARPASRWGPRGLARLGSPTPTELRRADRANRPAATDRPRAASMVARRRSHFPVIAALLLVRPAGPRTHAAREPSGAARAAARPRAPRRAPARRRPRPRAAPRWWRRHPQALRAPRRWAGRRCPTRPAGGAGRTSPGRRPWCVGRFELRRSTSSIIVCRMAHCWEGGEHRAHSCGASATTFSGDQDLELPKG